MQGTKQDGSVPELLSYPSAERCSKYQIPKFGAPCPWVPTLAHPPKWEKRAPTPNPLQKIHQVWGSLARLASITGFFLISLINLSSLQPQVEYERFLFPSFFTL